MLRGFSLPRQHAKLLAVQGKIVVAMGRRLLVYALGLAAVLVAGLALALWGLAACAPPPLPGDEFWTWRQMAGTALAIIGRAQSATCFTGEAAAMRDDLGLLIEELEDTCEKFEVAKQRRLERERMVAEKKAMKNLLVSSSSG